MVTVSDSKQFSIEWVQGYGVMNGNIEVHDQSFFCSEMGFTREMLETINGLNVDDRATLGEMFGTVQVTRIA